MRLSALFTYPIKGCYRRDHSAARVELWGLAGDRRWMVVGPDGRFLTQREEPRLTLVRPSPTVGAGLVLSTPGQADLEVPGPAGGDLLRVRVWRSEVDAAPGGAAADVWLSAVLRRPVRLVHLDDPTRRAVDPEYAHPDDRVSFADGYPLLLANAASLAALNDALLESGSVEAPLPMTRFRPNVVVRGAPAWAEDGWLGRRIRIGAVTFRAVKACDRCVVTTTDQETGERGREPLRVLAQYRRFDDGLLFGTNLIPDGTGEIALGDPVSIVDGWSGVAADTLPSQAYVRGGWPGREETRREETHREARP